MIRVNFSVWVVDNMGNINNGIFYMIRDIEDFMFLFKSVEEE